MVERPKGSAGEPPGGDRPEPIQITAEVAELLAPFEDERAAGKVSLLSRLEVRELFAKVRSDIRKRRELLS